MLLARLALFMFLGVLAAALWSLVVVFAGLPGACLFSYADRARCACYAAMRPALTAQTGRSAGLERTRFRAEYPRA